MESERSANSKAQFPPTLYIQIFRSFCIQRYSKTKLSSKKNNQILLILYQNKICGRIINF